MTSYMTRPHEIEKHPKVLGLFSQISNGNEPVLKFLMAVWNFEHVFDDLIDEGRPKDQLTKELMFKALADFVDTLLTNPFAKMYADDLRALTISAMTRALDGDIMEEKKDVLAPAVRCGDIDLVMHVAYLHRGWDFMRSINWARVYDTPDKEVAK